MTASSGQGKRDGAPQGGGASDLSALDGRRRLVLAGGIIHGGAAAARGGWLAAPAAAIAIGGERVLAIGSEPHCLAAIADIDAAGGEPTGARTVRVDLDGCTVIPGFVDAHTHLLHMGHGLRTPDLGGLRSAAAVIERVRAALDRHDPARPLIADGWDDSLWPPGDELLGSQLDRLSIGTPIILRRECGHKAVANAAAVRRLVRARPDLDRPELVDRARGMLLEYAALRLREVFPPDRAEVAAAIAAALAHAARHGVTAVHEIDKEHSLDALRDRRRRGTLHLRALLHLSGTELVERRMALGTELAEDEWLRLGGIKLFLDGSIGARTAALVAPYTGRRDERGLLLWDDEKLRRAVRDIHDRGLQIVLHAIGDRAIAQALGAFAPLGAAEVRARRHRIEHVELLPPPLAERLAQSGAGVCLQPNFVSRWGGPGGMYEQALGTARWRQLNRFRTLHDLGVPLAFGSDCMPLDPLLGIEAAIAHPLPGERLTAAEALAAYTAGAAALAPPVAADACPPGVLAPGSWADLVVLDRDPLAAKHPAAIAVLATVAGGRLVFDARDLERNQGEES